LVQKKGPRWLQALLLKAYIPFNTNTQNVVKQQIAMGLMGKSFALQVQCPVMWPMKPFDILYELNEALV
jgi:hypothetical protein